jgi:hypothetical protein
MCGKWCECTTDTVRAGINVQVYRFVKT